MALTLAVAACGLLGDEDDDAVPLPEEAPVAEGEGGGPELVPLALLESADALESELGRAGGPDVDRRTGVVVTDTVVVVFSVDTIIGLDPASGERRWTSDLDLGTGHICWMSDPDSREIDSVNVVVEDDDGSCTRLSAVDLADGTSSAVQDLRTDAGRGFTVRSGTTVGGRDYLHAALGGTVAEAVDGRLRELGPLSDSHVGLDAPPRGDVLIGSVTGGCRVEAFTVPDLEPAWDFDPADLLVESGGDEGCIAFTLPSNPAWVVRESSREYSVVQLDPRTGAVLGAATAPTDPGGVAPSEDVDIGYGLRRAEASLGLPDGDVVLAQPDGVARWSLAEESRSWTFDGTALELPGSPGSGRPSIRARAVSADGSLVLATLSNGTAVQVLAIDAAEGTLRGRWPVPQEYASGFLVDPQLTVVDGGVVLTRDFAAELSSSSGPADGEPVDYDVGIFRWPSADGE